MPSSGARPFSLVIAVASTREDQLFARELQKHLTLLSNGGQLICWFLNQIPVGSDQTQKIEEVCRQADLFLLLLSPDFWVAHDCQYINELAQERQREGLARVYQIKLRAVRIEEHTFRSSVLLPSIDLPINQWPDRDQAWTTVVGQISALVTRAQQPIFLAVDPSTSMVYDRIVDTLESAAISFRAWVTLQHAPLIEVMREVSSVLVLLSEKNWEDLQMDAIQKIAAVRFCPVIIVWESQQQPDTELPGFWRGRPFVWIGSPSFSRDLLGLLQKRFDKAPRQERPRNPYKGLRAFQPEDVGNFFGRTRVIEQLHHTLQSLLAGDQARLLTVVGRSGVGKSSVVLAGLLPLLKAPDVHWEVMKPGDNPLNALMIPLAHALPEVGMQKIVDDLKEGKDDIFHEYIQRIAKRLSVSTVVLVVDQLEELFLSKINVDMNIDVRHRFITLLSNAVMAPNGPLLAVLILRADFIHHIMAELPEFYRLLEAHQALILPMTGEEMLEAIEKPAFNASVQFEKDLARDMVLELKGQGSALPMVQVVLEQLFDARKGDLMMRNTYKYIGGVKGAIKQLGEEAYGRLPDEKHRLLVKKIFRKLIAYGTGTQEIIRQRMSLTELSKCIKLDDPFKERTVRESIAPFVDAQLLTTSEVTLPEVEHVPMIEVSHEAVLQEWPLLKDWIDEWDSDLRQEQAIDSRIEQWQQQSETQSLLYQGKYLKTMKQWALRNDPNEPQETFLRESIRQAKQSRLRIVRYALLIIVVLGITGGGGVWWQIAQAFSPDRVVTLQDDGSGSLRWCLATAPAGSTITIDPKLKGIIILKSTLTISKPVTVKGPGEKVLSLRSLGATAGLIIDAPGIVTLSDLGFVQGSPSSTPLGSTTINIAAVSTVHLNHVTIAHNHKVGIVNLGKLTLANATILDNSPSGLPVVSVGGIYNMGGGTMTISNSSIRGNSSSPSGVYGVGGLFNEGTLTITGTTILGNSAFSSTNGSGVGGVRNSGGTLMISSSTISSNVASGAGGADVGGLVSGGGVDATLGHMTISDSTISDNTASGVSGTHIGGVFSGAGTLTIAHSSITSNTALGASASRIGGVMNSVGTLTLANTTIAQNGSSHASVIYTNGGGKTTLAFCTVAENTATSIVVSSATKETHSSTFIQNTILVSLSIVIDGASSAFQSNGYNLVDAANASFFQQTGDRIIRDPATLFAPGNLPGSNGGVTQTLKIRVGSGAYNTIPVQACHIQAIYNTQKKIYTDQRDQPRPGRGKTQCDVGAYEIQL